MPYKSFILIFFAGILSFSNAIAQEEKISSDSMPSLLFEPDMVTEEPKKKKKEKKKVFYGLKCKRGFTKKGVGDKTTIESFFFLKHYKEPNPYVKKVYVYDLRKQQIVELSEIDKKNLQFYKILHGPYKKMIGGSVVEEGIFYVGTKHGRWERYAAERTDKYDNGTLSEEVTSSILIDKEKYYRGWPKESQISFYDGAHTKIKEVKPYEHGILNGDYFHFKENGEILVQGKYVDGKKAGIWAEYDPNKNRKVKETKYPNTPYVEQFEPYVLTEWDENGNIIMKDGKKVEPGKKGGSDTLKDRYKRKKK